MKRFLLISLLCFAWMPLALAMDWPQVISVPDGDIVLYQPQPEKLEGNVLTGRAAFQLELKGSDQPIFGAMWFSARLDTDRDSDTAIVRDLKVERVTWPESGDAGEQRFTAVVEGAFPGAGLEISMERLNASLATAEVVQKSLDNLNNDPPRIVFEQELAVLLLFDGEPKFSAIENSPYEKADNTPFAVARDRKSKTCYLTDGAFWYTAKSPLGPWTTTQSPPQDLAQMVPKPGAEQELPTRPAKIVAATEPTEVIATDGAPAWESLAGGALLYVTNTETPWLREIATGNMYLLLSGRWYRSKSESGPWTFVRPDELPASFSEIPPASDIGGLRTSVAGTPEAEEAVMDAAIPQTAAIKRSEAKLEVTYDGKPEFKKIEGTEVSYAVNTAAQVLAIGGKFYAVDDGVWFVSAQATGPWTVADTIPNEQIQQIPPSAPVYNTTYVQVYNSTPEVVYVGYTPGYLWSYPYYGVPVYGTGWYYPPYWGRYYYPRPPTWGLHVGWNPWTGWNFGVSWSNGFFSVGIGWSQHSYCCGGWYGGGYRGPVFINTGDINIGNNINIGNRVDINNRIGDNSLKLGDRNRDRNLYNRADNRARNAQPTLARNDLKMARPATGRTNDLFADRGGQVARRDGNDWQVRDQGGWKPAPQTRDTAREISRPSTPTSRPSTLPSSRPATRPAIDRGSLNRDFQARSQGASRELSRSRPTGGARRRH